MLTDLSTKRIVVAGLGISGRACLRFLASQRAQVSAWDTREQLTLDSEIGVPVTLGQPPAGFWDTVDMLVLSPGIALDNPLLAPVRERDIEILGEIELFARFNQVPVLGVTGSNGKTTVTLLTHHILSEAGLRSAAAGNVGTPAVDTLNQPLDIIVLELSSFQLETTSHLALAGATILNVSDDHLDRHKTLAAYAEAKQRIYNHADHALAWRDQQLTYPLPLAVSISEFGLQHSATDFGLTDNWITWQGEPLVDTTKVQLMGAHNILNIQAALGLAIIAGVTPAVAAQAVYSFASVAHRCVPVSQAGGITWIDDSKATNVGATIAAIEGLGRQRTGKLILIAGGDAKGADVTALQPYLSDYVDALITLGRDGPAIAALKAGAEQTSSMSQAVAAARRLAAPGDTVLLSPACASLDMFKNYEHRAQAFAQAITGAVSC
ncbi:UDP-N-acetylmuramoyl-L-alanine--D-glutamate ligase [Salinimonas sediminis]|uniref:UDP-N-acetylmuramoylalanine--D-glutamate ligase n=1 Tax=Salinimonas sediminis TaxID=2303538 RepID=A0A346NPN7_9ALTE|nr:UDP-N-acetylmuramoyl-L-alanine--D-glutamate ligase [Salinimonas sediminis]AXR07494.1 UDP-N-acetylmuramoyl-L-alanine--D-glutamate ligase [Salinimonas sediminis]